MSKLQMKGYFPGVPEEQHRDALNCQIKYRKQVLGNKPQGQTLLPLQCGKDQFSTAKLRDNLQ